MNKMQEDLCLLDDTVLPCEVIGNPKDLQLVWGHGLGPTDPRAMHRRSCESFPVISDSVAAAEKTGTPFSAVLFDARGHGKSSGWEPMAGCIQQFHWRNLAFDMLTVASNFRHLPIRKQRGALLGGFSMGASTALWAAHLCPTLVRGLVLFSVTTAWEIRAARRSYLLKCVEKLEGTDPAAAEVVKGAADTDLPSLEDLAASKLQIPVLLCAARDDKTHPAEVAERLNTVLPKAELLVMDTKEELNQAFPSHLGSWLQRNFSEMEE